jgi:hypothetical protein
VSGGAGGGGDGGCGGYGGIFGLNLHPKLFSLSTPLSMV